MSPEKQAEFLDRIVLKNSEHSDELKEMLFEKIPHRLEIYKNQQRPIKMIVIDSITAVIRPDFKQAFGKFIPESFILTHETLIF